MTYTPAAGWSGIATLTYIATDQYSQKSGPATVTITVAPVAVAVAASSTGQKTVTVQAAPHGTGPFTYSLVASTLPPAADGVVTVDPHTGLVSFAPATGFLGQFTVRYTVSDGAGVTSPPSTITFAVKGVAVTQQSLGSGTPDAGTHLASTARTAALLAVPGVLILLGCALPLLRRRRPGTVG